MSFKILILFLCLSFSLIGQSEQRTERQEQLIKSDSIFASILGVKGVISDLGNFIKPDTIYYPDKSILRISEANKNGLNGRLIYFHKNGTIYYSSKFKDNEYCDTSNYYSENGNLMMREIYTGDRGRTITEYYDTGELKRLCKVRVVDLSEIELKKDVKKRKQKIVTDSDQYYDKKGNKITLEEYRSYLIQEYKNKKK